MSALTEDEMEQMGVICAFLTASVMLSLAFNAASLLYYRYQVCPGNSQLRLASLRTNSAWTCYLSRPCTERCREGLVGESSVGLGIKGLQYNGSDGAAIDTLASIMSQVQMLCEW